MPYLLNIVYALLLIAALPYLRDRLGHMRIVEIRDTAHPRREMAAEGEEAQEARIHGHRGGRAGACFAAGTGRRTERLATGLLMPRFAGISWSRRPARLLLALVLLLGSDVRRAAGVRLEVNEDA